VGSAFLRFYILQNIRTIALALPSLTSTQAALLEKWLQNVLWESIIPGASDDSTTAPSIEVHRLKGRFLQYGSSVRVIQGVREMFEIIDGGAKSAESGTPGSPPHDTAGKLVLIGCGLDASRLQNSIDSFVGINAGRS